MARSGSFDKVEHICFTERMIEDALGHLGLNHIDSYPSVKTITVCQRIFMAQICAYTSYQLKSMSLQWMNKVFVRPRLTTS